MPEVKPTDFEEFKRLMMRLTSGDEKLARARALSFSMLWALAGGIPVVLLIDLVELLRFELERLTKEP